MKYKCVYIVESDDDHPDDDELNDTLCKCFALLMCLALLARVNSDWHISQACFSFCLSLMLSLCSSI